MASPELSRRRFLAAGATLATGGALHAFAIEPNWLEVTAHEVPVPGLPRGLDGFKIAQVTDAHFVRIGRVEERIAEELRAEDVQLLVLTGDILDNARKLPVLKEFCSGVRRQGLATVATLGNWEYQSKVKGPELEAAYADNGVKLLVNAEAVLPDGVQVIATDDALEGKPELGPLHSARGDARVLLTHGPAFLDRVDATSGRFALSLAGHTHGGQIRLGPSAVPFLPPGSGRFVAGWYDFAGGRAYVSRGTGTSLVPARFTCRPELPIFTLRQG